jgi:hypothetical protein
MFHLVCDACKKIKDNDTPVLIEELMIPPNQLTQGPPWMAQRPSHDIDQPSKYPIYSRSGKYSLIGLLLRLAGVY